jgi:hypothetical protein
MTPANSGFAEPSPDSDVTRDGRDTQRTDSAGSAVGGGAGDPAGDGMPGSMPVPDVDVRGCVACRAPAPSQFDADGEPLCGAHFAALLASEEDTWRAAASRAGGAHV